MSLHLACCSSQNGGWISRLRVPPEREVGRAVTSRDLALEGTQCHVYHITSPEAHKGTPRIKEGWDAFLLTGCMRVHHDENDVKKVASFMSDSLCAVARQALVFMGFSRQEY